MCKIFSYCIIYNMKTDIEILTDNNTKIILKLNQDVDFQKSLVAKLAARLEFHEERWRADVAKYENEMLINSNNVSKLQTRNKDLTDRKIFCSHCDTLILNEENEPETSQYNVWDCQTCDQLFCKACYNNEKVMYQVDFYSMCVKCCEK